MAIETDIFNLISSLIGGKCYPIVAPDGTTGTYITYQVISVVPQSTLTDTTGCEKYRIQIDIWGDSYKAVKDMSAAIKIAIAASSIINIPVLFRDGYEAETKTYRSTMDYSIWS